MPMHPEVAQATVLKLPFTDDPDVYIYELTVPGVGSGYGDVNVYNHNVPELGFFKANPERIGIGTRLLAEVARDLTQLGHNHVMGQIVHGDSLDFLSSYNKLSRETGTKAQVPTTIFSQLPIVRLMKRAGIDVQTITISHIPKHMMSDLDGWYNYDVHFTANLR